MVVKVMQSFSSIDILEYPSDHLERIFWNTIIIELEPKDLSELLQAAYLAIKEMLYASGHSAVFPLHYRFLISVCSETQVEKKD